MSRSTLGFSDSYCFSSVSRNEPIPPSSNTQKSRVTCSPDPVPEPPPPPLSLEQAAAISPNATSATNARFIRTLLTNDRREAPPIHRSGRAPARAPAFPRHSVPTARPWADDNVPRSGWETQSGRARSLSALPPHGDEVWPTGQVFAEVRVPPGATVRSLQDERVRERIRIARRVGGNDGDIPIGDCLHLPFEPGARLIHRPVPEANRGDPRRPRGDDAELDRRRRAVPERRRLVVQFETVRRRRGRRRRRRPLERGRLRRRRVVREALEHIAVALDRVEPVAPMAADPGLRSVAQVGHVDLGVSDGLDPRVARQPRLAHRLVERVHVARAPVDLVADRGPRLRGEEASERRLDPDVGRPPAPLRRTE